MGYHLYEIVRTNCSFPYLGVSNLWDGTNVSITHWDPSLESTQTEVSGTTMENRDRGSKVPSKWETK